MEKEQAEGVKMAKDEKTPGEEKIYSIPLRTDWIKEPRGNRTARAVNTVKAFLMKHTKTETVKLSEGLNNELWKGGLKKPPGSLKLKVIIEDGIAKAMLPDEVIVKKEAEKKGKLERIKEIAERKQATGESEPKEEIVKSVSKKEEKPEKPETKKDKKKGNEKEKKKTDEKTGQEESTELEKKLSGDLA